jgi:hypothetical protein
MLREGRVIHTGRPALHTGSYDARMSNPETATMMAFPDIDSAESALDWIGIDFVEGEGDAEGWFTGQLDEDAAALLEAAIADGETPLGVRALAQVLREQWNDATASRAWRVTFPA